ncbi:hypothetical protein U737_09010 [Methylomonas sp. LW13]|uniref:hypothetical protein n=1 Tax=unclassified Methylomonas TaxID=2608980 RepID=UPI00051BCB25|nr:MULTISPECIES: hypothetical protein [unclassified Methylomonas]PKD41126.1 hypothetical protein CWO84_06840 [Methylomonas sp. Kb3]QBC27036.1 hypothetical protein U737_09010 [Methylomonas sp. LW13]
MVVLFFLGFWLACLTGLWLWKKPLFIATWREPYFADTPVLIESDDWGPGGDFHAARLTDLLSMLAQHKDAVNRSAILTADMVLAVPDLAKIESTGQYHRRMLDKDFPAIFAALQQGIQQDTLVPQLHGMEHLNGKAFAELCRQQDPRLATARATKDWWDWEKLDSPLQGHYVDGRNLPTQAIDAAEANSLVANAMQCFTGMFGYPSLSTVAPCYLWNDEIEQSWQQQNIIAIQTAGYRCTGRDETGHYFQDPPLIRVGNTNRFAQLYLVRNVMYEPVDGKNTPASAFAEAKMAYRQALPVSISTHRYNYTRSEDECQQAIRGLDHLLGQIRANLPNVRFLASPELGEFLQNKTDNIVNRFNQRQWPAISLAATHRKTGAFLYRLYYRHRKLALIGYCTGLIVPAWLICKTSL